MTLTTYTDIYETISNLVSEIPDGFLPELKITKSHHGDDRVAWNGGTGIVLHSAKRGSTPAPEVHVNSAILGLLHAEAVRRLEVSETAVSA